MQALEPALLAGAALLVHFFYVRNLFFFYGADLLDAGWLADVVWNGGAPLANPPVVRPGSYHQTHLSPLLTLWALVSPAVMPDGATGFALLVSIPQALLALWAVRAVAGFRRGGDPGSSVRRMTAAAVVTFNGVALSVASYPHYEIFIAVFAIWTLHLHLDGSRRLAVLAWLACLTVREDAGLHVALMLAAGACAVRGTSSDGSERRLLTLAAASAAISVLAIVLERTLFPGDQTLERVYVGAPPFSHLSLPLVLGRLAHVCRFRLDVCLPFVACSIVAIIRRDPVAMLGWAAVAPWFLLNVAAVSEPAGKLFSYYAFPFLCALLWPLLIDSVRSRARPGRPLLPLAIHLCVIGASFLGFLGASEGRWILLRWLPKSVDHASQRQLIAWCAEVRQMGLRLEAGDGVISLAPREFIPEERLAAAPSGGAPDVVIFFSTRRQEREAASRELGTAGRPLVQVGGTTILVGGTGLERLRFPADWPMVDGGCALGVGAQYEDGGIGQRVVRTLTGSVGDYGICARANGALPGSS